MVQYYPQPHTYTYVHAKHKMPKKKQGPQRKHWVFTCNSPKNEKVLRLEENATLPKGVSYLVWQLEKGKKGHEHYQGYVEFTQQHRMKWLKRHFSKHAHWEARQGTPAEASLYCTKDDTRVRGPWILGKISKGAGARTDLVDFRDQIKAGKRKRDLWESHPVQMARYRHMYDDYKRCKMPLRVEKLTVILLVGKTGTGKTYTVHDTWKKEGYFKLPITNGTLWFDGYDMDENVLIDDFNGKYSKVRLDTLLRILHEYPEHVPVKGSYSWWLPTNIAITSNFHPREWYDWSTREEHYAALCRRIKLVMEFKEDEIVDHTTEEELKDFWARRNTDSDSNMCYCCNQNKLYKQWVDNKQ